MPSRVPVWPSGWPSFTPKDNDPKDTYQLDLKREIIAEYGADAVKEAWIKTCNALRDVTPPISQQGPAAVPTFEYADVVNPEINASIIARMKAAGCFIIRGVIPNDEATAHFTDLQDFIAAQPRSHAVTGWPALNPAIFYLYNSPVQLKLRTHPNQLATQRLLNSLFCDTSSSPSESKALSEPILYPDAVRVRCLLYTSPSPRDGLLSRMPSSA